MLCPYCAEDIKDDAIKCKHCGEWLKKEPINLKEIASTAVGAVTGLHDKVLGSNKIINPTDASPLVIDEELTLYGSCFSYSGTRLKYEDVRFVAFGSNWDYMTINYLLRIGDGAVSLSFCCKGLDNPICLFASSTVAVFKFKGKQRKLIENAYSVIASRSYRARFNGYTDQLKEKSYMVYYPSFYAENLEAALRKGEIVNGMSDSTKKCVAEWRELPPSDYPFIKIFLNGDLQVHHKGTYKQVNLKKAHKEGKLGLSGTEASSFFQTHTRFDPHQIIISEKKKCKPEEDILFHAGLDNGVICEIIAQIAKS